MKSELEAEKQKNADLEKQIAELKVTLSPRLLHRAALQCRQSGTALHDAHVASCACHCVCSDWTLLVCYYRVVRPRRSKLVPRSMQFLLKSA